MTYDAFGKMVEKYDGTSYWQELDSPIGNIALMKAQTTNQYRMPLPGGDTAVSGISFEHVDYLENVPLVSSRGGRASVSSRLFSPYGESYNNTGIAGDLDFTGDRQDLVAGTYDTPNRELNPGQTRWLSPDPAGASWNAYQYSTNPMSETDPSGLDSIRIDGFLATGWSISKNGLGFSNYGWEDKEVNRLVGSVEYDLAASGGNPMVVFLDTGWSYHFPDAPLPGLINRSNGAGSINDYQEKVGPISGFFDALNSAIQNVTGADEVEADALIVGLGGVGGAAETTETTVGHVFWSGGADAMDAAKAFAEANGGTTLEMTSMGQQLTQATRGMDWLTKAKPLWQNASADFARGAQGEVNVFQNGAGVSLESIWRGTEFPILQQQGNPIVYHIVLPNGVFMLQ
jgi:RHS repeat-associated protein